MASFSKITRAAVHIYLAVLLAIYASAFTFNPMELSLDKLSLPHAILPENLREGLADTWNNFLGKRQLPSLNSLNGGSSNSNSNSDNNSNAESNSNNNNNDNANSNSNSNNDNANSNSNNDNNANSNSNNDNNANSNSNSNNNNANSNSNNNNNANSNSNSNANANSNSNSNSNNNDNSNSNSNSNSNDIPVVSVVQSVPASTTESLINVGVTSSSNSDSGSSSDFGSTSNGGSQTGSQTSSQAGSQSGSTYGSTSGKKGKTSSSYDYDISTSINPRLPAGGVTMYTPSPTETTYIKIGEYATFSWTYTSLSVTPQYLNFEAYCSYNSITYTIATNYPAMSTEMVWDTSAFQANATIPLLTSEYMLYMFDSKLNATSIASAGYLAVYEQQFAMYSPQAYTPLSEWTCFNCKGNGGIIGRYIDPTIFKFLCGLLVIFIGSTIQTIMM